MSQNEMTVEAPPGVVWEMLADAPTYEDWVVGNKEIRDHDAAWPGPGAEFHHTVGIGPLAVKDKTVSLEAQQARRLVLNVRVLPIGHGKVTFDLIPAGPGTTRVQMAEEPLAGPAKVFWPLLIPLVKVRNAETLRRLKRCAEARQQAAAPGER
ncbi:MAG TPA: SRPBCC family protein [Acidimicrobiia bacterium]|nr:SRPBCC family protein [Acidimicrobiia bacterium]